MPYAQPNAPLPTGHYTITMYDPDNSEVFLSVNMSEINGLAAHDPVLEAYLDAKFQAIVDMLSEVPGFVSLGASKKYSAEQGAVVTPTPDPEV